MHGAVGEEAGNGEDDDEPKDNIPLTCRFFEPLMPLLPSIRMSPSLGSAKLPTASRAVRYQVTRKMGVSASPHEPSEGEGYDPKTARSLLTSR